MSDHIGDATEMVGDTPRTDAAEYESIDEPVVKLGSVDVDFARQLERELIAANQRIERLEEAVDAAIHYCEFHGPVGATPDTTKLLLNDLRKAKEAKP